jgi:hypothetical protein
MRWLLVEAAWRILRAPDAEATTLPGVDGGDRGAPRKRIAVVALARRLAGILYALWRDDVDYRATPVARAA